MTEHLLDRWFQAARESMAGKPVTRLVLGSLFMLGMFAAGVWVLLTFDPSERSPLGIPAAVIGVGLIVIAPILLFRVVRTYRRGPR